MIQNVQHFVNNKQKLDKNGQDLPLLRIQKWLNFWTTHVAFLHKAGYD